MILRALFWIVVVAIFMPHEPDLGLGRPESAASPVLGLLDNLHIFSVRSFAQVKAEIEESQRERALHARTDRAATRN